MSYRHARDAVVGPCSVVPCGGSYRVLDHGNGQQMLAPKFKTKAAAERWAARQVVTQDQRDAARKGLR